ALPDDAPCFLIPEFQISGHREVQHILAGHGPAVVRAELARPQFNILGHGLRHQLLQKGSENLCHATMIRTTAESRIRHAVASSLAHGRSAARWCSREREHHCLPISAWRSSFAKAKAMRPEREIH